MVKDVQEGSHVFGLQNPYDGRVGDTDTKAVVRALGSVLEQAAQDRNGDGVGPLGVEDVILNLHSVFRVRNRTAGA
ncbi:MAG: hypothetical protein KGS44_11685 [Alphaproteobacteria bacterium]|nr:hypothetical protein [Alphaproteobacteria bacterium]